MIPMLLTKLLGYGVTGLLIECLFTGIKSWLKRDPHGTCQTYLVMAPIYSATGILMESVRENLRWNPILLAPLYLLIMYSSEFLWGLILHKTTGICPWDYGKGRWSIMGYINLKYWYFWLALALCFNYISLFLHSLASLIQVA